MTPSIATALRDLKLDAVTVIAPVARPYALNARVHVTSLAQVLENPERCVTPPAGTGG